jgi:hypothetical protein
VYEWQRRSAGIALDIHRFAESGEHASSGHRRKARAARHHLPECNSIRTLATGGEWGSADRPVNRASAEPEVVFRIVHVALDDGYPPTNGSPQPSYREQTVEIALGPDGAFESANVGRLTRRVPSAQVVNAVPPPRRKTRSPAPGG